MAPEKSGGGKMGGGRMGGGCAHIVHDGRPWHLGGMAERRFSATLYHDEDNVFELIRCIQMQ